MADIATGPCQVGAFLTKLSSQLCEITNCEVLIYSLYQFVGESVCNCIWREGKLTQGFPDKTSVTWSDAWDAESIALVSSVATETRFPTLAMRARDLGLQSFCVTPLTAGGTRVGTLVFGSSRADALQTCDLALVTNVAKVVALMLENARLLSALQKENDSITRISGDLQSDKPLGDLLSALAEPIRAVVHQDFTGMLVYDQPAECLRRQPLDFESESLDGSDDRIEINGSPYETVFRDVRPQLFAMEELRTGYPAFAERLQTAGLQSLSLIPIVHRERALGVLALGSTRGNGFLSRENGFLQRVAMQIGAAIEQASEGRQIAELKARLEQATAKLKEEYLYLENEVISSHNFAEIIGESPNLRRALAQVQTVAPSDTTVLILGETGTGKELVARAIHRMSSRNNAPFIKLNCAAIPTGLLESELFGHEKGAFTGAVSQKVGRLELADIGTLFLDEVGDISPELQPKLLRVLQDQEFERLGGTRTIRVNVRLVAATNRDLSKSVAAGQFRSDLFYRLYVFPVRLPALRERVNDIPLLVRYFVQRFARRMGKQIDTIPADAMTLLSGWRWPGNVRELENFVERSILLTTGHVLQMPLSELRTENWDLQHESTLHSIEREHILRVLRETGGVIAGIHGAAVRLGMKRTTLQSRMQRMGINRAEYEN